MVSNISSSNSTNLTNLISNMTNITNNKLSETPELEDFLEIGLFGHVINTKEELWQSGDLLINSLDSYTYSRKLMTDTTGLTDADYANEYQEYMKSRGCSSEEELKALSSVVPPCHTKNDLIKLASGDVSSCLDSLSNCGIEGISQASILTGSYADSILSNASLTDISNYLNTDSTTVSDRVTKFQTLLKNICNQDNVSAGLKSSLTSLSNNISNASESIDKYSAKVEEENAKVYAQKKQYFASLIANYQS